MSAENGMLKIPYLIQRATIPSYKSQYTSENPTFNQVYGLDYMGSSEFEFGAIPKSFTRIIENLDKYSIIEYNNIKNWKTEKLMVFIYGDGKQYIEYIKKMGEGELDLKERIYFEYHVRGKDIAGKKMTDESYSARTQIWWDIDNDVFFCFGKEKMNRLVESLKNSRQIRFNARKEG